MPLRAAGKRPRPEARDGFRAVGRVERSWGLRGHLKVLPLTDFPERFAAGKRLFLRGEPRHVLDCRWRKGRVYLHVEGVEDVAEAESLRGELLEVPDDDRPELAEDEYFIDEIEGCTVRTESGEILGSVREVLQAGANDVYVVARAGRRDLLIPAIHEVVREVNLDQRVLLVSLIDGLDPDAEN